ncbi:hypothetical protein JHK87_033440 [Glycine soja]|nr:hypothetical protein JHK87_033440 [Glycine soja]
MPRLYFVHLLRKSSEIEGMNISYIPLMLNRQVVKVEYATIKIPKLDFEIPPEAQRGSLSTILLIHIPIYFVLFSFLALTVAPKTAKAIHQFLVKLRAYAKGKSAFTFILDDPAGNSFIENPPPKRPKSEAVPKSEALLTALGGTPSNRLPFPFSSFITSHHIVGSSACTNVPI